MQGRRSGEIMGIEEEDEDEIEEVEEFSPVLGSAVEVVEEPTAIAETPFDEGGETEGKGPSAVPEKGLKA